MCKFEVNSKVKIKGESIGGFDFKNKIGIVKKVDDYFKLYKVLVENEELTYLESKLEKY